MAERATDPHAETKSEQAAANTDRELWREGGGDGNGMSYYEPSIHVTAQGRIGINVGGFVITKTLREWHALAVAEPFPCGVCSGQGAIPGFWLGTVKTCPACHGKGVR